MIGPALALALALMAIILPATVLDEPPLKWGKQC